MLMDEVQGRFVEYLPRIPEQHMHHVYRQIAKIVLQLRKVQFPLIGLPQRDKDSTLYINGAVFEGYQRVDAFASAKEFYLTRTRRFSQHLLKTRPFDDDWVVLAWLYLQAIPLICPPEIESGPFPLRHPDLNNANLLYDDDYNIVAVIDWTATQSAPLQSFVVPPNQFERVQFHRQRMLYIDTFEEVEREENPDTPLTKLMRSPICEMTELVDGYYGWTSFPDGYATRSGWLVFDGAIEWEQVRALYLKSPEAAGNVDKDIASAVI